MLETMPPSLLIFATAFVVENLIFARAIACDDIINQSKSIKNILKYGLGTLMITLPAVVFMWAVKFLFEDPVVYFHFEGILCIIAVTISFFVMRVFFLFDRDKEKVASSDKLLLSVTYNCAALGLAIVSIAFRNDLLDIVMYCIGGVFGMTVAILLIHSGRERLAISGVGRSFQGLPIILVYIGILSLAIYGLIGHQLPT